MLLHLPRRHLAAVLLALGAVGAAAGSPKPVFTIVPGANNSLLPACRIGKPSICQRVTVDYDAIRNDQEIEFDGKILKRADMQEENGASYHSFIVS
jgi:hypothetical protein